jgi:lactoylglutathione lyase
LNTGTTAKPNVSQAVPFFMVADIDASTHFYVDGIGFEMTHTWVDGGALCWCWLQLGGAALMLQQIRREGHDGWSPQGTLGEGVSIYFICRDALAIYRDVRSRGIDATRPQVGNGMWVTSLSDPDGYRINFESETDVAEETVFTG